jgi:hypothetical protein
MIFRGITDSSHRTLDAEPPKRTHGGNFGPNHVIRSSRHDTALHATMGPINFTLSCRRRFRAAAMRNDANGAQESVDRAVRLGKAAVVGNTA